MSLDDLLNGWVSERRDVSFPFHQADVPSHFTHYGFSDDGGSFSTHWSLRFAAEARVTAAFTGTALVLHQSPSTEYFLAIAIASARPIQPLRLFPSWYPIPEFARYGPFSLSDIEEIARNLLTDDGARVARILAAPASADEVTARLQRNGLRRGVLEESARRVGAGTDTSSLIAQFIAGAEDYGIGVAASEVLFRLDVEQGLRFWLHPSTTQAVGPTTSSPVNQDLYMDPSFYFSLWGPRRAHGELISSGVIENFDDFPAAYRDKSIGPPLASGGVHYVRQTVDPSIAAPQHTSLGIALAAASSQDVILILDKALYHLNETISKFISIISLRPRADDPRELSPLSGVTLSDRLRAQYPSIQGSTTGSRGMLIQFLGSTVPATSSGYSAGMIYIAGLSVSGNNLNPNLHDVGGAGILVRGDHFTGLVDPATGYGFSSVHVDACAICNNGMGVLENYELKPFLGGGILCLASSPVISGCLIKENTSLFQGGGVAARSYAFPHIIDNAIVENTAVGVGTQMRDADGGGIGIFQAFPRDASGRLAAEDANKDEWTLFKKWLSEWWDELSGGIIATFERSSRPLFLPRILQRCDHRTP